MNLRLTDINNPSLGPIGGTPGEGGGADFIARLVSVLITTLLITGAITFLLFFLLGAISWITSGGDAKATEAAKAKVTQAVIGLFIMFSAWAIFNFIQYVFNINLLEIDLNVLKLNLSVG